MSNFATASTVRAGVRRSAGDRELITPTRPSVRYWARHPSLDLAASAVTAVTVGGYSRGAATLGTAASTAALAAALLMIVAWGSALTRLVHLRGRRVAGFPGGIPLGALSALCRMAAGALTVAVLAGTAAALTLTSADLPRWPIAAFAGTAMVSGMVRIALVARPIARVTATLPGTMQPSSA